VKAESVPVAWFDPPAAASGLVAGDEVVVVGRVRRRFFRAGGATASRTEVVAAKVVPARSAAKVRAALAPVLAALEAPV
jgi:single-strand DNA-binding protein